MPNKTPDGNTSYQSFVTVLSATFAAGLLAHGFVFFNVLYNSDSLMITGVGDEIWQISLGRYLQPLYYSFRGPIQAPWLIGILELLFLSLAIFFTVRVFNIVSRRMIVSLCAVMATYVSLTCSNATYLPWSDMYMLALMLAAAAAFLIFRRIGGRIVSVALGAVCIALSMGLYQSFLAAFVVLAMLYALYILLNKSDWKQAVTAAVTAVITAVLGGLFYIGGLYVALSAAGVGLANSYNGIASVGDYGGYSVFALIKEAYKLHLDSFTVISAYQGREQVLINLGLALASVLGSLYILRTKKAPWQSYALFIVILALFPLGSNLIYVIAKFEHSIMTYPFVLSYVMPAVVLNEIDFSTLKPRLAKAGGYLKTLMLICFAVLTLQNVICANQVYTKKKLVYDSTTTILTRVLYAMEDTEGYVSGETPVHFYGQISANPHCNNYNEFELIDGLLAVYPDVAVTSYRTYINYFHFILNSDAKVVFTDDVEALARQHPELEEMPIFPADGYCAMIDGEMYVKIAEHG